MHRVQVLVLLISVVITAVAVSSHHAHANAIVNVPFGPIEFLPLHATPNTMLLTRLTDPGRENLIVTYESSTVSVLGDSIIKNIAFPFVPELIVPVRNTPGNDLLACVPIGMSRIEIVAYDDRTQSFRRTWSIRLSAQPRFLRSADITGNGNDDLIVVMEDMPGIGVLRSRGDGTYGDPEFLFEDLIVSQFQVVDLNGDGINDIILYDPIQNILRIHYGFGRMLFTLERVQPLPATADFFRAIPIVDEAVYDLLIAFPQTKDFRIFMGDGLGRYSQLQTLKLTSESNIYLFCNLFDNKHPDLAVLERDTGMLRFFGNRSGRGFEPAGNIMLGSGVRAMAFVENGGDGTGRLYVLDGAEKRLIVLDKLPVLRDYLPEYLAIAGSPADMVTANLFGGNLPELYVLSRETPSVSVYWYDELFRLNHSMIPVPGSPEHIFVHKGPLGRSKIVVSDRESDLITIISVAWDLPDLKMYGIPVMTGAEVIYLGLSPDNRFQFGTVSYMRRDSTVSVSLYEQLGSDEYIEHTITPVPWVVGLVVVDVTGNDVVDIVYMYQRDDGSGLYLTSALNDSDYGFRRHGEALGVGDVNVNRGFLMAENAGKPKSFIVYLELDTEAQGRLMRVQGASDGTLSLLDTMSDGGRIRSQYDVCFISSFGKPFHDIVYYNERTHMIEIVGSGTDGSFADSKPLREVSDCSSFTVFSEPLGEVHMLVMGREGQPYLEVSRIND